jgi:hypothetical protein
MQNIFLGLRIASRDWLSAPQPCDGAWKFEIFQAAAAA